MDSEMRHYTVQVNLPVDDSAKKRHQHFSSKPVVTALKTVARVVRAELGRAQLEERQIPNVVALECIAPRQWHMLLQTVESAKLLTDAAAAITRSRSTSVRVSTHPSPSRLRTGPSGWGAWS